MSNSKIKRRDFFRVAGASAIAAAAGCTAYGTQAEAQTATPTAELTPDQALARLKAGNADFLSGKARVTSEDKARRLDLAKTQSPFAVLVGCSDSRVPPGALFGVGLGELFIIRNAGNTVDTVALGSIEYGTLVLKAPLIVVLGHERCGAVHAALEVVQHNKTYPGQIGDMIEPIIPAVLKARTGHVGSEEELLDASVRENVRRIVNRMRTQEPSFAGPLREGKLKIVGARYDLDTGAVDFFDE